MTTIAKPIAATFRLPRWAFPRFSFTAQRRKRATIDLIHSSQHLLRDIGVMDGHVNERTK